MKGQDDSRDALDHRGTVRAALEASLLRRSPELRSALYVYDAGKERYTLSLATGFAESEVNRVRRMLTFRYGEERGIVGLVAAERMPLYVPDCVTDERWIGSSRKGGSRSAYFVPIVYERDLPDVFCILSPEVDDISVGQRELADLLADMVSRLATLEAAVGEKLADFERILNRLTVGLKELSGWHAIAEGGAGTELSEGLRSLSPREWEILERFGSGQRVTTMSRALKISPHTVRNHLKSICRKLGVQSQGELRERLGEIEVWRGRQRGGP